MWRVIMLACLFVQLMVAITIADELPDTGRQNRFNKTLEGMPRPDTAPPVGIVKGFIQTSDGTPLAGGEVYFFNEVTGPFPAPEKYWRVPDKVGPLDEKGGFTAELPPGRYYVGAIQRKGDKTIVGPPSNGDIYYAGKNIYEVLPASQNNLEVIKGAKTFSIDIDATDEGGTAIEGLVVDTAGKPVENAVVFAHMKVKMNDRPLFVSRRTGKNGAYRLRVAGNGTYYLRVRDIYGGGMPAAGTVMGVYGDDNPKAVTVKEGEVVKGLNIVGVDFIKPRKNTKDSGGK